MGSLSHFKEELEKAFVIKAYTEYDMQRYIYTYIYKIKRIKETVVHREKKEKMRSIEIE